MSVQELSSTGGYTITKGHTAGMGIPPGALDLHANLHLNYLIYMRQVWAWSAGTRLLQPTFLSFSGSYRTAERVLENIKTDFPCFNSSCMNIYYLCRQVNSFNYSNFPLCYKQFLQIMLSLV